MTMDHQPRSPSSPAAIFAHLMQTHQQAAQQYTAWLVRRSKFLGFPDQDDIYAQGMIKLWQTYFCDQARQPYHYQSQHAELNLIKATMRNIARDLIEQRRQERNRLRLVELDALDPESIGHRHWSQNEDFTQAVAIKLELEQLIHQQERGSTLWWVALYLSGNASRAQLAGYSDGNLRTSETRLRQKFKALFCESC